MEGKILTGVIFTRLATNNGFDLGCMGSPYTGYSNFILFVASSAFLSACDSCIVADLQAINPKNALRLESEVWIAFRALWGIFKAYTSSLTPSFFFQKKKIKKKERQFVILRTSIVFQKKKIVATRVLKSKFPAQAKAHTPCFGQLEH